MVPQEDRGPADPPSSAHVRDEDADRSANPALRAFLDDKRRGGATEDARPDLVWVFQCLQGDPDAVRALREAIERYARATDAALVRNPAHLAELVQTVAVELLVGGRAPYLESYAGRGRFGAWLRLVVARRWYRLRRQHGREEELGDAALAALGYPDAATEPGFRRDRYRAAFRASFRASLARLSERDRDVLALHLRRGLCAEAIGERFGVHRVTVARWLQRIRGQLLAGTRRELQNQLGVTESAIDEVLEVLGSRLEASFSDLEVPTKPPQRGPR